MCVAYREQTLQIHSNNNRKKNVADDTEKGFSYGVQFFHDKNEITASKIHTNDGTATIHSLRFIGFLVQFKIDKYKGKEKRNSSVLFCYKLNQKINRQDTHTQQPTNVNICTRIENLRTREKKGFRLKSFIYKFGIGINFNTRISARAVARIY